MVYEWDEHQQTCYRLYIEEGKSLEDIRDHMKNVYKFTPSVRAFRNQFRRWNFPLKQRIVPEIDRAVNRVKELWERNLSQPEMLRILKEEGFDIELRELVRLRVQNRWFLRTSRKKQPKVKGNENLSAEETHNSSSELTQNSPSLDAQRLSSHEKAPLKVSKRQQRRKGRGLEGQDGKIVRFPSETTLDDARQMLGLTVSKCRDLRSYFQKICEEEGILKKTDAGAAKWDLAKEKLIRQMPELQHAVWSVRDKIDSRQVALDVICTDVTKRMRIMEAKMTLAQAKNLLGINPEQFRELRLALYDTLSEAGFTRKSDATSQQWENLKRAWSCKSAQLQQILANINSEQRRALDVLTRDILKRRPDGRQDEPENSQQQQREPQPQRPQSQPRELPSRPEVPQIDRRRNKPTRMGLRRSSRNNLGDIGDDMTSSNLDSISDASHTSQMASSPANNTIRAHIPIFVEPQTSEASRSQNRLPHPSRAHNSSSMTATTMALDSQMGTSMLLGSDCRTNFIKSSFVQSQFTPAATPTSVYHQQAQPGPTVCAIYMRLHPSSSFVSGSNLWIATLTSNTVQELRQMAAEKFPGTICIRVEAVIKDGKGGELPLPMEHDQELSAYIAHLQGAAPTFNVQMIWKTS